MNFNFQRCWLVVALALSAPSLARADIFRWDNGQLIPGTAGITPGPGVQLDHRELGYAELSSRNLTGSNFNSSSLAFANLFSSTLTGANLSLANLGNADIHSSTLTSANLTGQS